MAATRKRPAQTQVTVGNAASVTITTPNTSGQKDLADLAAKLLLGQVCEGGCNRAAEWSAVAPHMTRFGCRDCIGALLDTRYIWFLHPMSGPSLS